MRYKYGAVICTFGGAGRVELLLKCLDKCRTLEKFSSLLVVEDLMPGHERSPGLPWFHWRNVTGKENHEKLLEVMKWYPDWKLISLEEWGNMQGCANRAIKECDADWVWYLSDDLLTAGDPFRHFVAWAENADPQIMFKTGLVAPTIYNACDELVKAGWLKDEIPSKVQVEFYTDPFNTWFKNKGPTQFSVRNVQVPQICAHVNGATFIVNKNAWKEVDGIDPNWDVLDQELSYSVYLETEKFIYSFPTDPFYHMGGCAQNVGFPELRPISLRHREEQRCVDNFGSDIPTVHACVFEKAIKCTQEWQGRLIEEYFKIANSTQAFHWSWE